MFSVLVSSLFIISRADKQFSLDSDDATGTQDWNGLVILVNADANDEPEIVFSSNVDGYSLKYCLTLEEMYEASAYDYNSTSDKFGDNDEVSNSEIDFSGDVDWAYSEGTDGASFTLTGTPTDPTQVGDHSVFESLVFTFQVAQSPVNDQDWGVEYVFELNGYEWTEDNALLVLVFKFKDCGSDFESADFSDDGDTDGDDDGDDDDDDDDDTTAAPAGRRLLGDDDDDDSEGSDDGVSSDDSQEVDVGIAYFINHGEAHCVNDTTVIPTHVVYGNVLSSDEMHIVFEHFDCEDIVQDPYVGTSGDKRTTKAAENGAFGYRLLWVFVIGIMMMFV